MTTEDHRTLDQRLAQDYAPAWRPTPGSTISGFVTDIDTGYSEWGDYPIVTVDVNGTRYAVHAFHTVLRDALIDVKPTLGETIGIRYNGRVLPKNYELKKGQNKDQALKDNGYESYRVLMERTPADIWGKFDKASSKLND